MKWWKYLLRYCLHISVHRSDHAYARHDIKGWYGDIGLCPLLFVRWGYRAMSFRQVAYYSGVFVRVFPGFIKPGTPIKLTFEKIWELVPVHSDVPQPGCWDKETE